MIEEERQTGFEHRAPKKKPAGAAAAGGGPNGPLEFVKIVKLDTAIVDADAVDPGADTVSPATTEVTATKMATMMTYYNKSSGSSASNYGTKRPSDTLIKCFKIDDLELDESKV